METIIKVEGMTCKHCEKAVKDALLALAEVSEVTVDLASGEVKIAHEDQLDPARLKETVEDQGYDVL